MLSLWIRNYLPALCAACMLTLANAAQAEDNNDPLEPMNRAIFSFNQAADSYVIHPFISGYRYVAPAPVRSHIGNVADNLLEPVNTVNALLQGDITQGAQSFWRFVINTTLGLGGINDVATVAGLPERHEDFGQTLGAWGVGPGPYLVLPLLGPSSVRDTTGLIADIFTNPINYYVDQNTAIGIGLGEGIVKRDRLGDTIDDINASSLDPYASMRSIYQQHRAAQISNSQSEKDTLDTEK